MATVSLKTIRKRYPGADDDTLEGIDLAIRDGELLVLVGPSGCGKSTLLRIVAGLESITGGELHIGERKVNDLPPKERDIAMVFQSYALYPHMTVRRNMSFALEVRKTPREKIDAAVDEAAKMLGLSDQLDKKPAALSGGQRQRVAMGRAIVRRPKVFLFDEPLSNLDAALRAQMRVEIKELHRTLETTIIYVTHDQVEAMTLADRIAVLDQGVLQQVGAPMDLFDRPANKFVAGFIGSPSMNFVQGVMSKAGDDWRIDLAGGAGTLRFSVAADTLSPGDVLVGIRPQDFRLAPELDSQAPNKDLVAGGADVDNVLVGEVRLIETLGWESHVHFEVAGAEMLASIEAHQVLSLKPGDAIRLQVPAGALHLFDPISEHAILHGPKPALSSPELVATDDVGGEGSAAEDDAPADEQGSAEVEDGTADEDAPSEPESGDGPDGSAGTPERDDDDGDDASASPSDEGGDTAEGDEDRDGSEPSDDEDDRG